MDDTFLRMIFFGIDKIIYQFIPTAYSFIKSLIGYGSGTGGLFGNAAIADIARNIYSLLGVLMIIKLAFSMIQYIVNPDLFDDKTKGFASLIKRVFVVLILIVAVPYIFDFAYRLQDQIVNNQIIEKVILGNQEEYEDNSGNLLSERTLQAFLKEGDTPVSLDRLGDLKINEKVASGYRYDYMYLLSTIAGAFVLFLLIVFSYDIALRIVKLGFLQLIAPIPVISYLDPKNSFKDGIMGKWVKITLSSYLALFTRIMSIAFLIFVINIIPDVITDVSGNNLFIILLLIIGTLMFVKEAPKLIGDIFGLDMSSSLGGLKALNPLGKMAGGGLLGGALGFGTGWAMRGAGAAGGALRGGFNSAIRGESFKSGALKGAIAGSKDIPTKGGLGKQVGALWKGGRAAANAGASYATGQDTKTGLKAFTDRKMAEKEFEEKAINKIKAGQRFRTAIDSNGEYGKVARDAIKNSNMTQLQKDKETARLNVKGKASVISNTDFRTQYENYELAKSFERAEKGELNRLEIDLDNKRAGFQRGEVTFDQLNSAQDAVKTQRIEVAKAESAKTTLEAVYNEAAKLGTNADDVKSIAQLKAYDDQKSAIDNISKVTTSNEQTVGTQPSATTSVTGSTIKNNPSVTRQEIAQDTEIQNRINDVVGINRESKNAYESAKAFGEPTVEDRQVSMDDLLKNNQDNGNSSTGNK